MWPPAWATARLRLNKESINRPPQATITKTPGKSCSLAMKNEVHVPFKGVIRDCWRKGLQLKIYAWKYHTEIPLVQLIYANIQLLKQVNI
jgi:hypothetical protein